MVPLLAPVTDHDAAPRWRKSPKDQSRQGDQEHPRPGARPYHHHRRCSRPPPAATQAGSSSPTAAPRQPLPRRRHKLLKGRVGGKEAIRHRELLPPRVRRLVQRGPRPAGVGSPHRLAQGSQTLPANLGLGTASKIGIAPLEQRVEVAPRLLPLHEWKHRRVCTATSDMLNTTASHSRPGAVRRSWRRPLREASVNS